MLSSFAFKFSLRRYTKALAQDQLRALRVLPGR
jgi:hypothetical protein